MLLSYLRPLYSNLAEHQTWRQSQGDTGRQPRGAVSLKNPPDLPLLTSTYPTVTTEPTESYRLLLPHSHLEPAAMSSTPSSAFVPSLSTSSFLGALARSASTHQSRPRASRARVAPKMVVYNVEIQFHGTDYLIPIDEDQTLLEGIENCGLEVPYSCRAGVCTTCAAKIIEGDVDLGEIALMAGLKEDGYVLTCSGKPRGEGIKLIMDQFDEVYNQQYGKFEKEEQ